MDRDGINNIDIDDINDMNIDDINDIDMDSSDRFSWYIDKITKMV